jgi:hypothetical protein
MVFMRCDLQDPFSQDALLSFCASLALKFAEFKLDLRGIEASLPRPHVYAPIKISSACGGIAHTISLNRNPLTEQSGT